MASWSTGGTLLTVREYMQGFGDSVNSAGVIAGYNRTLASNIKTMETYDGASWSAGTDCSVAARGVGSCGTPSSALKVGGYTTSPATTTEEWNGSAWSSGGALSSGRYAAYIFGTQNAAVAIGGSDGGTTYYNTTFTYNGTGWSTSGTIVASMNFIGCVGTQSAGLLMGGNQSNTVQKYCQSFDGATWTSQSDTYGNKAFAGANGSSSDAMFYAGGYTTIANTDTNYKWNGASWSLSDAVLTARRLLGSAGNINNSNSAICMGGYTTAGSQITEIYDNSTISISSYSIINGLETIYVVRDLNITKDQLTVGFIYSGDII